MNSTFSIFNSSQDLEMEDHVYTVLIDMEEESTENQVGMKAEESINDIKQKEDMEIVEEMSSNKVHDASGSKPFEVMVVEESINDKTQKEHMEIAEEMLPMEKHFSRKYMVAKPHKKNAVQEAKSPKKQINVGIEENPSSPNETKVRKRKSTWEIAISEAEKRIQLENFENEIQLILKQQADEMNLSKLPKKPRKNHKKAKKKIREENQFHRRKY